jgi:eukaryotic translation initiation factor 2C
MIHETCQAPLVRSNKISAGINVIQTENNENLKHFNIDFSDEMISVNARILPVPSLEYHKDSIENSIKPHQGSWNLKNKKFVEGINLISWAVVIFGEEDRLSLDIIQNFIITLCSVFSTCGITVKNSTPPLTYADVNGNIEHILTDAYVMAERSYNYKPQMIFCMLPNTGISLYSEIKRVSDSVLGIVTQCIQGKHVIRPKIQFCANLALKVNAKLGGQNSRLPDSFLPFVTEKPCIILGADVTVISFFLKF